MSRKCMQSGLLCFAALILPGCGEETSPETRARSSMASELALPGISMDQITGRPTYSPDGTRLAFSLLGGGAGVYDFAAAETLLLGRELIPEAASHTAGDPVWISSNRLVVRETWQTPDQEAGLSANPPQVQFSSATRVIDVPSRTTVAYDDSAAQRSYAYLGVTSDGGYLRTDASNQHVVACTADAGQSVVLGLENASLMGYSSLVDWIPWIAGSHKIPFGTPVHLKVTHARTGDTRDISAFPRPSLYGVVISPDGRLVLSANYHEGQGWTPVIYSILSGQPLPLPAGESWIPIDMSEARGMLLVLLRSDDHEGQPICMRWCEIPLGQILPQ